MDDIKKIYKFLAFAPLIMVFLIIALVLMIADGSNGDPSAVSLSDVSEFTAPFKMHINYGISSPFGYRTDPFTKEQTFHSGIDLTAPAGTEIVASAGGKVWKTGYEENGLGNYVKIEHDVNGVKYYTAYGHMLDNSIKVSDGEIVQAGTVIGTIGSTGRSTGIHLHFMLMTPNCTYSKSDLQDPQPIIDNDLARRKEYKYGSDKFQPIQPYNPNEPFKPYQPNIR